MLSRSPSSTRLRLEPFEDRLCPTDVSLNFTHIEYKFTSMNGATQVGTGDLADDAGSQETIAVGGYIRVKKLTS